MKKIIAVLVSISILTASEAPLAARSFLPAGKASATAVKNATRQAAASAAGKQAATNLVLKSTANVSAASLVAPSVQIPATGYQGQVSARAAMQKQAKQIQASLTRSASKALSAEQLSFEQILYRANQGQTAFLPQAILNITHTAHREQLLRSAFVTAAAAGEASAEQLAVARQFWRTDLLKNISLFGTLYTRSLTSADDMLPIVKNLQDMAALALLGTETDMFVLKELFFKTKASDLEPLLATLVARGLLIRENWEGLQTFFAKNDGIFPTLQNGIAAYVNELGLPVQIASTTAAGRILPDEVSDLLQGWGPVLANATDSSLAATKQWVTWAKNQKNLPEPTLDEVPAVSPKPAVLAQNVGDLLPGVSAAPVQVQAAALPVQEAGAVPAASLPKAVAENSAVVPTAPAAVPPAQTTAPVVLDQDSPLARFQRASLYLSAFVMGLEVATPVITNFGTSFGLSLQDNILVSAATYTPYSVGALLSNQLKKVLGRKGSMNLGLAMMATGFLGGVGWAGLDGAFTAEADTMMQFYKALACITLASTGGVFVHNSVGPIMTELNAGASELVRQKRNATAEFTRALGMASSFAFPFIATKLLGQDWSFTFAMPLPIVAAALLGVNLIHLPNTRPLIHHATEAAVQTGGKWLQRIKNNEYVRLFKEEKGAGALLAGLAIMNAVEVGINNGFLFLLPSLTKDPSSQYLFGMAQFAAPFILGRYLAKRFLTWFPGRSLSVATGLAASGIGAAVLPGIVDNVYALTTSLFLAETGISTLFTLSFARTAKNPATMDRLTTLIVASALACAVGPVVLSDITQMLINSGIGSSSATAAAMIGIPAVLTLIAAKLFNKVESASGKETAYSLKKLTNFIKNSLYIPKFRRKRS